MNEDDKSALQQNHDRMVKKYDDLKREIWLLELDYLAMAIKASEKGEHVDAFHAYFLIAQKLHKL